MTKAKIYLILSLLFLILATGAYVLLSGDALLAIQLAINPPRPVRQTAPDRSQLVIPTLEPGGDPALRNPLFAGIARKNGPDWERTLHPDLRQWVDWQRKIGTHALITGFGLGNPGLASAEPKFVISVTEWDHADLFELGLPRTFDGKPVKIIELGFAVMGSSLTDDFR